MEKIKQLISVIIPVWNGDNNYLEKCIQSIINQTYANIEIILVDDGSNNGNAKICDEYSKKDNRIIVIHQENQGVSMARNNGIKVANGEWITFVDADDYIEPDFCKRMLSAIENTNAQCVQCAYNRVYNDKIEKIKKEQNFLINREQFIEGILYVQSGFGFCHMKLWKTSIIKENNIQFNSKLKVSEDAMFCLEMSKHIENVYFLNELLYNYRFNSESVVRKYDENYVEKYFKAIKTVKEYVQNNYDNKYKKEVYNYISYHILLILINYCFHPKNENKGIKIVKEICHIPEFEEAILYCTYDGFSLTRKIALFTLKHKLYILSKMIANIRQHQFKK